MDVKIGERLRALRKQKGVTQETLAKALGTTANTVSRWETETYKISAEDLNRVAQALGIESREFFRVPRTIKELVAEVKAEALDADLQRKRATQHMITRIFVEPFGKFLLEAIAWRQFDKAFRGEK